MFSVLVMSGCMFFPSESFYSGGFAWVGDDLYLYAPMCESEKLEAVQVYTAEENPTDHNQPLITDHWNVSAPVDEMTSNGWIVLGDDAGFGRVLADGEPKLWPTEVFIKLTQSDDQDEFTSGLYFPRELDIPAYPVGSDPLTIDYLFENPNGRSGPGLYSPEEIRDQMGCAKQHF